jgi:hypothetical protein
VAGSLLRRFQYGRYAVSTLFTSPDVQGNDPISQGRVLETEGATDRSSDLREGSGDSEITVSWCFKLGELCKTERCIIYKPGKHHNNYTKEGI